MQETIQTRLIDSIIAENFDGYLDIDNNPINDKFEFKMFSRKYAIIKNVPHYHNDLNAINRVVRNIRNDLFSIWSQYLVNIVAESCGKSSDGLDMYDIYSPVEICGAVARATALEHIEALLRTLLHSYNSESKIQQVHHGLPHTLWYVLNYYKEENYDSDEIEEWVEANSFDVFQNLCILPDVRQLELDFSAKID